MRITKNTFEKALNTYTDEQQLPPNYYTDAHNITLTSDRKFYAPTNIKGTFFLTVASGETVALDRANVKTVSANFKIDGNPDNIPCLVHFITGTDGVGNDVFSITCQRLQDNQIFYMYEQVYTTAYFGDDRLIDARVFPENGIDFIYFTDNFNELRVLRCEIPTGAADNFLTDYDLSLQRRGANGAVLLDSITSGGSLLSGTYQYAYRMVDPVLKKYTKWSSLSQPVHVYGSGNTTAPVYSAVGLPTSFSVVLDIIPSPEEAAHFSHYQLAVVENIYGVTTAAQPASLLQITAFTGPIATFTHEANQSVGTIPVTDITVDLAAIKSVKTLAVKQNRLFGGNIQYHELEVGDVTASGEIIAQSVSDEDAYSNHEISSTQVGYFRDEVYRFGIIYKDKFGNRSPVRILDLNAVTGNTISGTIPDVRFPNRTDNNYSLLDATSSVRIMGLDLTITGHPEWAVGFEIVRAKRKKRILFQTPVIPMTYIEGIGAHGTYPSQSTNGASDTTDTPDAQPQSQSRIYTPKNLFWPELRGIVRRLEDNGGAGADKADAGEAQIVVVPPDSQPNYSVIFPQGPVYGAEPFVFTKSEKVETVDYAVAKTWITDLEKNGHTTQGGDHLSTSLSGGFYALDQGDYYFDSAQTGKTVFEAPASIKDAAYIENGSTGTVMGGNKIMMYSSLSGQGVNWGTEQQPQRCAVIETAAVLPDVITNTDTSGGGGTGPLTFANATLNQYAALTGAYITDASGPAYELSPSVNNKFINEYAGYANASSYVQAFRIANVVADLDDDRYGAVDSRHEFISTGASYTFTEAELEDVQDGAPVNAAVTVYGGDCFIAAHTFKLCDTWYAVTNQPKNHATPVSESGTDLTDKWGRWYRSASGSALCVPVALEGASTFVQLIIESEYNGGVMAEDIIWAVTTVNDFPVMNLNDDFNTAGALRSPLLYAYNKNLSKQNDQKTYLPLPEFNNVQNSFGARVVYSDLKIYQSDVQGFDIFRVGNIHDLEESRRSITKLAVASDDLYAIQQQGIVLLPVGETQITQTNAGILAVGTGDVIGRPIVIEQDRGSQHLRGIAETGSAVFIPDGRNQTVYRLAGRQVSIIDTASDIFSSAVESDVVGFYDGLSHEYFLSKLDSYCFVYNEFVEEGSWIANYEFDEIESGTQLKDGVWCNNRLHIASLAEEEVSAWVMYEGDYNSLLGHIVTPRISFVVNPESDLAKTFDDMTLISTQRLDEIDLTVPREASLGNQENTQSLDSLAVEGGYRIKTLRDDDDARLRGQRMLVEVRWKTGPDDVATLSSVLTKYRLSSRTPF